MSWNRIGYLDFLETSRGANVVEIHEQELILVLAVAIVAKYVQFPVVRCGVRVEIVIQPEDHLVGTLAAEMFAIYIH